MAARITPQRRGSERIIHGTVDDDGDKKGGSSGWTAKQSTGGDGVYTINFSPEFTSAPTVVVTQIHPNDLYSSGGNTLDNAVIVGVDHEKVKIKTGDNNGNPRNRWFSFIAVGR